MKLTDSKIQSYHTKRNLIVDSLFTPAEIQSLKAAIQNVTNKPLPAIIREENDDIRSIFVHYHFKEEFAWLYKQEQLVTPEQQLLDSLSICLYQYKLNNKKASDRGIWEWYQDFTFWYTDNGVKEVEILPAMGLMQDAQQVQVPPMFTPEYNAFGIATFQNKGHLSGDNITLENSLNGDLKFMNKNELKKTVDHCEIKLGTFKIGTIIFVYPYDYQGFIENIFLYDRNTVIIIYNRTSNLLEDRKKIDQSYMFKRF